eukprot:6177399-Pleurochrysis_carterae.AAC.4
MPSAPARAQRSKDPSHLAGASPTTGTKRTSEYAPPPKSLQPKKQLMLQQVVMHRSQRLVARQQLRTVCAQRRSTSDGGSRESLAQRAVRGRW